MNDPSQEVRLLLQELQAVQRLKSGSVERQQKEDRIYDRLYDISNAIKTHSRDPAMAELYTKITGEQLPRTVNRLPIYTDEYKLFTEYPTTPKTELFLSKMGRDLAGIEARKEPKELLKTFVSKCDREQWLERSADMTCKHCWNEVMQHMFMMVIEMLTVELKQRAHQIRTMTEQGYLTEIDAQDLAKHMDKIIYETEKLLDKASKHKHKKEEWILLIESLFQLMVGLINEIMSRYMQFVMVKREVK